MIVKLSGKDELIKSEANRLLRKSISDDYCGRVIDAIIADVISDVDECADDLYWNEDDVKLALGRVLLERIGIEF